MWNHLDTATLHGLAGTEVSRRVQQKGTFVSSLPITPCASGSENKPRSPIEFENPWCKRRSLGDHTQGFCCGDLELYVKSLTYCAAKNNTHQVALVGETNELVQAVH
jgi:hypothetical protein